MNNTSVDASVIVTMGDTRLRMGDLILQIPSNFVYVARDVGPGFKLIGLSDIRAIRRRTNARAGGSGTRCELR